MTAARKHIEHRAMLNDGRGLQVADYLEELVALPGWPQYCVRRVTLHRLINGAAAFSWLTPREKEWTLGYAQYADQGAVVVDYAGAVELFGTEPLGPMPRHGQN